MQGLFDPILRAVSGETIQEHIQAIWEKNRFADFDRFRQTADYVFGALEGYGLKVDRYELPADGETRYGDAVMPMAWDCVSGEISMISPRQQVIVTREENPNCVGMWSPATPPEGLEADLLCLQTGEPRELENRDAKGLFVYTPGKVEAIRELAVQKEAAGVVSSWTPAAHDRDSLQWLSRNSSIPGGWGPGKNETPILQLAVSPKAGNDFVQMSTEGLVRLRVKVDSRLYAGSIQMLSAFIPGEIGEEILIYTPLYGQGANFNAATVAALMESARLLKTQVDAGSFPLPYRGIRFLFMPKQYGSIAFAQQHRDIMQNVCYALYLEAGAGNPDISWSRWSYRFAPACRRHYADGLAWKLFQLYLKHWRPQRFFESRPVSLAGDVLFNDSQIGIPTHWLYGGTDTECRNSSADVPQTIDARSGIDLASASTAMIFTMASIGTGDIPDLAVWNYNLSQERLREDLQLFLDHAKEASTLTDLNELLSDASRHFPLRVKLETEGLLSLNRLGEGAEQMLDWEAVKELTRALKELGDSAMNVLRAHLNVRADELNIPLDKLAVAPEAMEDERVPVRIGTALGAITLDAIPYDQWTTPVKQSPRNNLPYTLAWWLVDGQRSIGEIQRLLQFEVNRYRECIPAWFNFLEKHGYVTLKEKSEEVQA